MRQGGVLAVIKHAALMDELSGNNSGTVEIEEVEQVQEVEEIEEVEQAQAIEPTETIEIEEEESEPVKVEQVEVETHNNLAVYFDKEEVHEYWIGLLNAVRE